VGNVTEALVEDFAEDLKLRERGAEVKPKNLIPAMVAHLLRSTLLNSPFITITGKTNRQKINRLLDEHVFCGDSHISPTRRTQIWRDAKRVAEMEDLFDPGPMRLGGPFSG
jgi:hypothetical protein